MIRPFLLSLIAAGLAAATVHAQAVKAPWPDFLSPEAKAGLAADAARPPEPADIAGRRARIDAIQREIGLPRLARHGVTMAEDVIAGVPVRIFTPAKGAAKGPVLLNLHGGGFIVDAGSISENAAVAALTGYRVVAVRYRLIPEHRFPAAVDDALAVYRALLADHDAARIGVYGTSAGAILSAELVARLRAEKLPQPAALGFFSGAADLSQTGDSAGLFADASGVDALARLYAGEAPVSDPLVSPQRGDLAGWPATLCLASTRDFLLSGTADFCRAIEAAGAPAKLVIFDGLPHAFWAYIDAPESDAAFAVMARFFMERLGSTALAVPAFTLPVSNQLSDAARAVLGRMASATAPADIAADVAKQRAFYGRYNDDRLAEMRRHFQTRERRTTMNGVPVDIVEPANGIAKDNTARVLINVHGGAFMWGSGSGALVEAIPVATTMGVKVVTVDYRLAPEHRYPAASEDVTAVYKALLEQHRPENIGIYGCSAGGVITAQATAWIGRQGLPRPGAIGTFCGTGAPYSGDSPYLAGPITGGAALPVPALPDVLPTAYMQGVPASDGAAYPLASPDAIAAMPPTLLLAGGRDFAVSALTLADRRLTAAGVTSELHLFDGLPHAFFVWPDMPESMEAYRLIASFFDRHLGRSAR